MVKYRPHRGMLSESIDGAKEFDTIDQMYDYILNDWNTGYDFFDREDLSISEYFGRFWKRRENQLKRTSVCMY